MDSDLKLVAEKTLKYLCIGSEVEGIKFYGTQLLFSESDANKDRIDGQIYLNIESRFNIYPSENFNIPSNEDELPEFNWAEAAKLLCELRLMKVKDVRLGLQVPNLFIYFDSGHVLFVFGHHSKYESWQLGVLNNSNRLEHWDVIAVPGDNIAVWSPDI